MFLSLFIIFLSLSLILVALGLFKPEHSELSLTGFTLMFILSFTLINNGLELKTGEFNEELYIYGDNYSGYHWDYINPEPTNKDPVNLFHTNNTTMDIYDTYPSSTRAYGFWLCIASVVGFIGVLAGLKGNIKK